MTSTDLAETLGKWVVHPGTGRVGEASWKPINHSEPDMVSVQFGDDGQSEEIHVDELELITSAEYWKMANAG